MKVLISVTHLLGSGHLSRALTLGRAFNDVGHQVVVASGGHPAPHLSSDGITLEQLPSTGSDGVNFTRLLDQNGAPVDEGFLKTRQDHLCDLARIFQPDILITELYPFGRRVLASEFLALLQAARQSNPKCVTLSSVRDILAPPSKLSKAIRADQIIQDHYDAVLVHADPQVTKLGLSWPVSADLQNRLLYTGYVAPPALIPHPDGFGKDEVLVSAGGGSVGFDLFKTAVGAAAKSNLTWRLLVGGPEATSQIQHLRSIATTSNVIAEPLRPDFRQMLPNATCSISMCGYNTAMDILQTATPAVFIPFDAGGEVEQTLRSTSLAQQPSISLVASSDLAPNTLLGAMAAAQSGAPRTSGHLQFNGATESVRLAEELGNQRL